MTRLLRAEVRKLLTTKVWWGMLLGCAVLTALEVTLEIAANGSQRSVALPLQSALEQRTILGSASTAYIFALIVGIIVVTSEFRHFTTRPTFLAEPHRGRVVGAKVVIGSGLGLIYGAVCVGVAAAIAIPWFAAKNITLQWSSGDLYQVLFAVLVVVAVYSVIGIGVGVLIPNQIAAIIVALVYVAIIQGLLDLLANLWTWFGNVYKFLPGAATDAVIQGSNRGSTLPELGPWAGGFVLVGWGVVFAAIGWLLLLRRDIP